MFEGSGQRRMQSRRIGAEWRRSTDCSMRFQRRTREILSFSSSFSPNSPWRRWNQLLQQTKKTAYPKVTNKMSISNLIVVLGPNLLWESDTLKTVSLEHVCRFPFSLFLWPDLVTVQFCIAKLCLPTFPRQIALYSPCRSVGCRRHVLLPLILPP